MDYTERVPRRGARVFWGLHEDAELHSEICKVQEHGKHCSRSIAVDPEKDPQVWVGSTGQSLSGNSRRSKKSDPKSGGKIRWGWTQRFARRYPDQTKFPVLNIYLTNLTVNFFSKKIVWIISFGIISVT